MDMMQRRAFMKGAGIGALAFTVGGGEVLLTPGAARAQGVPFRLLNANEGETIEALGETLVPGARKAGIAHFIDQQISVPAEEALLQARIFNVRPPFANFYRAAIGAVDRSSEKLTGRRFAALSTVDQRDFVRNMFQNKVEGWTGPGPRRHHDFINVNDFPRCWLNLDLTVEVEAKAKELAVLKLKRQLEGQA